MGIKAGQIIRSIGGKAIRTVAGKLVRAQFDGDTSGCAGGCPCPKVLGVTPATQIGCLNLMIGSLSIAIGIWSNGGYYTSSVGSPQFPFTPQKVRWCSGSGAYLDDFNFINIIAQVYFPCTACTGGASAPPPIGNCAPPSATCGPYIALRFVGDVSYVDAYYQITNTPASGANQFIGTYNLVCKTFPAQSWLPTGSALNGVNNTLVLAPDGYNYASNYPATHGWSIPTSVSISASPPPNGCGTIPPVLGVGCCQVYLVTQVRELSERLNFVGNQWLGYTPSVTAQTYSLYRVYNGWRLTLGPGGVAISPPVWMATWLTTAACPNLPSPLEQFNLYQFQGGFPLGEWPIQSISCYQGTITTTPPPTQPTICICSGGSCDDSQAFLLQDISPFIPCLQLANAPNPLQVPLTKTSACPNVVYTGGVSVSGTTIVVTIAFNGSCFVRTVAANSGIAWIDYAPAIAGPWTFCQSSPQCKGLRFAPPVVTPVQCGDFSTCASSYAFAMTVVAGPGTGASISGVMTETGELSGEWEGGGSGGDYSGDIDVFCDPTGGIGGVPGAFDVSLDIFGPGAEISIGGVMGVARCPVGTWTISEEDSVVEIVISAR